ncbi:MAG: hypothetical protein KatS3mg127_1382 [Silanimonas sp.]|nr:MAG: hypothetical protein KatS3mg127_1382 [Silanimonas sp.]
MNPVLRSRATLLLVVALFFVSFGIAVFLIFSDWRPTATRNAGELLQPPVELGVLGLSHADGRPYPEWESERRLWRVVVLPPPDCGEPCLQLSDMLYRVWVSEGRYADRLQVLWFGEVPAQAPEYRAFLPMTPSPALRAKLPAAHVEGSLAVHLIDPNGFLVMRYEPGFDPTGLRKDLARLLKVTE